MEFIKAKKKRRKKLDESLPDESGEVSTDKKRKKTKARMNSTAEDPIPRDRSHGLLPQIAIPKNSIDEFREKHFTILGRQVHCPS